MSSNYHATAMNFVTDESMHLLLINNSLDDAYAAQRALSLGSIPKKVDVVHNLAEAKEHFANYVLEPTLPNLILFCVGGADCTLNSFLEILDNFPLLKTTPVIILCEQDDAIDAPELPEQVLSLRVKPAHYQEYAFLVQQIELMSRTKNLQTNI